MHSGHCTHSWIGSFAERLIQRRRQTSLVSAIGCAVASFHDGSELHPHLAVDVFLLALATTARRTAVAHVPRSRRWMRAVGLGPQAFRRGSPKPAAERPDPGNRENPVA